MTWPMTRPDHRRVLDNLDYGWPAETVTWAQAEYDAELRARQPDDPGVAPRPARFEARDDFDRHALRAPVRVDRDAGPAGVVALLALSAGASAVAVVVAVLAVAWGL